MSPPSHDDRPPGADDPAQGPGAPGGVVEDVSAYLDGELTDAEILAFEAELERNAALRADLDEIREVSEWLAAEGPTEAPMGFANRVLARIEEEHPAPSPWWTWLRRPFGMPLEGVVVALSAAIVLALVIPRATTPPERGAVEERAARQSTVEQPPVPLPEDGVPTTDATEVKVWEDGAPPVTKKAAPQRRTNQKPRLERNATPKSTTAAPAQGTGDFGLVETLSRKQAIEAPTDAYEVPSPSDAGTPSPEAPFVKPSAAAERAVTEAHFLPVRVSSDDPEMLGRMLKLAARFGGAMDARGEEISDPVLRSRSREIYVSVRQEELPDFERQLGGLGYQVGFVEEAKLLAGERVVVQLQLIYDASPAEQPGSDELE
ncbi:MAG: hypothetical protein AAGA48_28365 [Myxococcota bacterium]